MRAQLLAMVVALGIAGCAARTTSTPSAPPAPPAPTADDASAHDADAPTWIGLFFREGSAQVTQVMDRSPAAGAGILEGDVVMSIAGTPVIDAAGVIAEVRRHRAGERVAVVVDRGGMKRTFTATIALRPDIEQLQRTQLLGKPAPDITLPALDGTTVRLADLRGRVVMIDFWATWCGPCHEAMPALVKMHAQLASKGLTIVGVTDSEVADVRAMVAEYQLAYPIALDPERTVWRSYLVQGIPMTLVVDKSGVIRYIGVGAGDEASLEAAITKLL